MSSSQPLEQPKTRKQKKRSRGHSLSKRKSKGSLRPKSAKQKRKKKQPIEKAPNLTARHSMTTDDLDNITKKMEKKSKKTKKAKSESDDSNDAESATNEPRLLKSVSTPPRYKVSDNMSINSMSSSNDLVKDNNSEALYAVISQLKFENKKMSEQLLHKDKLYEQKLRVLESNICGKEEINKQLQKHKMNLQKQLVETQSTNNELMSELMSAQKKQHLRLPRNNDSVSSRVKNAQSSGCCSIAKWWSKKVDSNSNNLSRYDGSASTGGHY